MICAKLKLKAAKMFNLVKQMKASNIVVARLFPGPYQLPFPLLRFGRENSGVHDSALKLYLIPLEAA